MSPLIDSLFLTDLFRRLKQTNAHSLNSNTQKTLQLRKLFSIFILYTFTKPRNRLIFPSKMHLMFFCYMP